jgi:hypothetical protein
MILETGPEIRLERLFLTEAPIPLAAAAAGAPNLIIQDDDDLSLRRIELRALVRALERAGRTQSRAARLLGVSRDNVRYWRLRFGIKVETRVTVSEPQVQRAPSLRPGAVSSPGGC